MPHASGNPTWQDYPSTQTLITAQSLEGIENTIDGLAVQKPVVEARLSADYTGLAATTWYAMRGQMAVVADPLSMWSQPVASGLYVVTIPNGWGGRYEALWQCAVNPSSAYATTLATVLLNCPPGSTNPVAADYYAVRGINPGVGYAHGSMLLNAGDQLSFALFCVSAFDLKARLNGNAYGDFRTKLVVRYVGPT